MDGGRGRMEGPGAVLFCYSFRPTMQRLREEGRAWRCAILLLISPYHAEAEASVLDFST